MTLFLSLIYATTPSNLIQRWRSTTAYLAGPLNSLPLHLAVAVIDFRSLRVLLLLMLMLLLLLRRLRRWLRSFHHETGVFLMEELLSDRWDFHVCFRHRDLYRVSEMGEEDECWLSRWMIDQSRLPIREGHLFDLRADDLLNNWLHLW